MKIALCLSGQPRFVEEAFDNIQETLIEGNDVDVFVHTWVSHEPYEFRNDGNNNNWKNVTSKENVEDMIMDLYNPKDVIFDRPKTFYTDEIDVVPTIKSWSPNFDNPTGIDYWINMQRCMWYSIHQSVFLKEVYRLDHNINYDYIIKHRFDLTLNSVIDFAELDPDILYSGTTPHDGPPPSGQIRDWMFIGNNANINAVASTFMFIKAMADKLPHNLKTNESFSCKLMELLDIPVEHIPIVNRIIRP